MSKLIKRGEDARKALETGVNQLRSEEHTSEL